jgi:RecB family endonuclease NucS
MISGVALRKSAIGWKFASEAALEKFIWEKLQELFGLNPLKQQYISQGEISDILAVDNDGGLVVLELKNAEDRYLIQQLTRYYANLLEEKPFQGKVDYARPVRLIAIAPTYHRHNLIDKEHSTLKFELLQFSVLQDSEGFEFMLRDLELGTVQKCPIPYQAVEIPVVANIPEPPDLLLGWLGSCSPQEQAGFLKVRNQILSCSPRMKEIVDKKTIQYGSGRTKLCAEICFQQKTQKPILFLWLPTPMSFILADVIKRKIVIGRLRIWTNGTTISHLGHIPEGFGTMKLKSEWEQIPREKRPNGMLEGLSSQSRTPVEIEAYVRGRNDEEKLDLWDVLSNLAVQKWLQRA